MSGEEFVLVIVAMVMSAGVIIVGITKITDLIKSWINRNKQAYDDEAFDRLAKAFIQHKKQIDQRVAKLETSSDSSGDKSASSSSSGYPELEEHRQESTLQNDLESKKRVR